MGDDDQNRPKQCIRHVVWALGIYFFVLLSFLFTNLCTTSILGLLTN